MSKRVKSALLAIALSIAHAKYSLDLDFLVVWVLLDTYSHHIAASFAPAIVPTKLAQSSLGGFYSDLLVIRLQRFDDDFFG